jgi:hypothetical protein
VVDLAHRDVLTIAGPDRLSWLHSLTSQHLTDLPPHTSAESLVLTPNGHVEHALHLVDDGERIWITVEPGTGAALAEWLRRMQFLLRVEVGQVTAEYAVLGEPIAAEGRPGEPPTWRDPWPGPVGDTTCYGPAENHPGAERAWREVIVPREQLRAAVGDRPLAGIWAAEAARIASWRPRLGADTDHRTIPARAGLAAHGGAPAQGLLSGPGDGGPRAQSRAATPATGVLPPRRVGPRAAGSRRRADRGRAFGRALDERRPACARGPHRTRRRAAQHPGGCGAGRRRNQCGPNGRRTALTVAVGPGKHTVSRSKRRGENVFNIAATALAHCLPWLAD